MHATILLLNEVSLMEPSIYDLIGTIGGPLSVLLTYGLIRIYNKWQKDLIEKEAKIDELHEKVWELIAVQQTANLVLDKVSRLLEDIVKKH